MSEQNRIVFAKAQKYCAFNRGREAAEDILCLATPEDVELEGLKRLILRRCAKPFAFVETSKIKGFMAQKFFCGLPYEPFKNDLGDGILSLQPRKGSA